LGVEAKSVVLPIDAYRVSRHLALVGAAATPLDLAFIDPPYAHTAPGPQRDQLSRLLAELAAMALAPEGILILRHPAQVDIAPIVPAGLHIARVLTYGTIQITWLQKTLTT
jgi:16S rRNA G966 N2-methylase RsmD